MTELEQMGIRIKERRAAAGLTLEELAARIGVAASTVQRYETGRISRPKLPVVKAIADALGCTADSLAGIESTENGGMFVMPDDSMAPYILRGDKVVFSPSHTLADGLLLCSVDGAEQSVYRVACGKEIVLSCDNPYYPPRVFPPAESGRITVNGRAVRIIRELH